MLGASVIVMPSGAISGRLFISMRLSESARRLPQMVRMLMSLATLDSILEGRRTPGICCGDCGELAVPRATVKSPDRAQTAQVATGAGKRRG